MFTGKVWKFGNDIDTDQIIPSQYLLLPTINEMKQFTFEPLNRHFASMVKVGDIILGGENFGSGSSREQAPRVLKDLGVRAVVAKSFARIFFRNSINIGLTVIICNNIYNLVQTGDFIEVNVEQGIVKDLKTENVFSSTKLPKHIMDILDSKGLIQFMNNR